MIAYLRGKVVSISPTSVIIEPQGGIGFELQISLFTFEHIKELSEITLYTHLHIKKDGQNFSGYDLFGFTNLDEKNMFELLLSVSGIGANTARIMLSSMNSSEIRGYILTENESQISSIKGIGPKTAKRLILELKDKVMKSTDNSDIIVSKDNKIKEEALLALMTLGYQKNNIIKTLQSIELKNPSLNNVEEYIKHALKVL